MSRSSGRQVAWAPHSHDAADSIDTELEASAEGVRALKISLVALLVTAVAQAVVVWFTGSVALLADTIHPSTPTSTITDSQRSTVHPGRAGG